MTLRIAVVCDSGSWMQEYARILTARWTSEGHTVLLVEDPGYESVDIAFFLSYSRVVAPDRLASSRSNIVVHGSALPEGRGWSPWSWKILEGQNHLPLTLFEAVAGVDAGPIYDQRWLELEGHELIDEWQAKQAEMTMAMCADFVRGFPGVLRLARHQEGKATYYQRRCPADSRIDPNRPLADQFGLLRIVDNKRYPAYFDLHGETYVLTVRKRGSSEDRTEK